MRKRNAHGLAACELRRKWHHMAVRNADYSSPLRWCLIHESNGEFLHALNTNSWYFENEIDAMLFSLKWL